jgi:ribonuclease HI
MNVDGSSIGIPRVSGFKCLIQNSNGVWVHGFAGNKRLSNILHAKPMAVYHGLVLAWGLGITELLCYSGSKTVIKLIYDHINA